MGLAFALEKLGKTQLFFLNILEEFNILNGNRFLYNGDYSELNPEIMFAVDCGDKERLERLVQFLTEQLLLTTLTIT